jgi:hypothetical protein
LTVHGFSEVPLAHAETVEHAHHAPEAAHEALAHHFDNLEQQREAGALGMWVFIAQEVMFFGGLFLAYLIYRMKYPTAFMAASNHLDWKIGTFNTAVLITSSLTMALAVWATPPATGSLPAAAARPPTPAPAAAALRRFGPVPRARSPMVGYRWSRFAARLRTNAEPA